MEMRGPISGMREPFSSLIGPNSSLRSGLEVFDFHWSCARLGALDDDGRTPGGPIIFARGETELDLLLQDMF